MTFLLLLVGLVLLVGGGDLLVRGASGLARRFGVSPLVVGLTVVAFGTSAPELSVNVLAALEGRGGISFGNVVGSNLANLGMVLGLAALVRPLAIRGQIVVREIPFMLLATALVLVLVADVALRGSVGIVDRADGLVLLLLFAVFVYAMGMDVVRARRSDPALEQASDEPPGPQPQSAGLAILLVLTGLVGLIGGGELTVGAASEIARMAGLSEAVIGMTIVAVGTSLPEAVAAIIATLRGETDLALGNVVGSNVFNLLLVLGTTSVVRAVEVPERGVLDLGVTMGASILVLFVGLGRRREITRPLGGALLVIWAGYATWRTLTDLG